MCRITLTVMRGQRQNRGLPTDLGAASAHRREDLAQSLVDQRIARYKSAAD